MEVGGLTTFQKLVLYYLGILLLGAGILMLPIASKAGMPAVNFIDAIFTATSALCVTGLVTLDMASTWSFLGQFVIIVLVQIGGIGISILLITVFDRLHKRESVQQSLLMKEDMNYTDQFQIFQRIKRVIKVSLAIEGVGALILFTQFIKDYSFIESLWFSIFHSISAFCNAGLDLFGNFDSLVAYQENTLFLVTVMVLITMGSVSYPVLEESYLFLTKRIKKMTVHVKVIIFMYVSLFLVGFIVFLFLEADAAFAHLGTFDTIVNAMFLSTTPRTAGFTSVDLRSLTQGTQALKVMLMFIGGAPASTAGGVKVTTVFVMLAAIRAYLKEHQDVNVFGRRIDKSNVTKAYVTFAMYIVIVQVAAVVLSITEPQASYMDLIFEIVSAITTVGSTLSITPLLSIAGKLIVMALMFFGRLGAVTIGIALFKKPKDNEKLRYPAADIIIG